jgi:GTPase SAR1 family protein
LVPRFVNDQFPNEYNTTVFDTFSTGIVVDGSPVELTLFDTAGTVSRSWGQSDGWYRFQILGPR